MKVTRYATIQIVITLMAISLFLPFALGAQGIHTSTLDEDYDAVLRALEAGESPNSYNLSGLMPLHSAARVGSAAIAELLLDNGAEINVVTNNAARNTPLHLAAINGNGDVVDLLLERDANPNLRNAAGNTPLHEAAIFGSPRIVRSLVRSGADITITNEEDQNPVALAINDVELLRAFVTGGQEVEDEEFSPREREDEDEFATSEPEDEEEEAVDEFARNEQTGRSVLQAEEAPSDLFGAYFAVGVIVPLFLTDGVVSDIDVGSSFRAGVILKVGQWSPLGIGIGADMFRLDSYYDDGYGYDYELKSYGKQVQANLYAHLFPLIFGFASGPLLIGTYFDGGVFLSPIHSTEGYIGAGGQIMINFGYGGGMYARGGVSVVVPTLTRFATPVEVGYSWWF